LEASEVYKEIGACEGANDGTFFATLEELETAIELLQKVISCLAKSCHSMYKTMATESIGFSIDKKSKEDV
jgi:hypothetical protein